jgi:hypothetical protein
MYQGHILHAAKERGIDSTITTMAINRRGWRATQRRGHIAADVPWIYRGLFKFRRGREIAEVGGNRWREERATSQDLLWVQVVSV